MDRDQAPPLAQAGILMGWGLGAELPTTSVSSLHSSDNPMTVFKPQEPYFFFLSFFFFLMWTIFFKVFIEFVTILFLFYFGFLVSRRVGS